MRSWSRVISLRRVVGVAVPLAFLALSGGFAVLPVQPAQASTYNPEFMQRIKNGLRIAEQADLDNYNAVTGCQYLSLEEATNGFNEAQSGSGEPARPCQNAVTAENNYFETGPKKLLTNGTDSNSKTQYFVKQEGDTVMACAVTSGVVQANAGANMQNALYQAVSSDTTNAPLLTPVAFFNNLSPPGAAPAQKSLRILTAGGAGDLMTGDCQVNPSTGICEGIGAAGSSLVTQAMQNLKLTADRYHLNDGGGMGVADNNLPGDSMYKHASMTEAGLILTAPAAPQGRSTYRKVPDTADRTTNRSDNRVPNESDSQGSSCSSQIYGGGCAQ